MREAIVAIDTSLLHAIFGLPRPDWLTWMMAAASVAGIGGAIWMALTVLLLLVREIQWRDLVRLVAAIALVHVVVDLGIKPWVDRPRPQLAAAGFDVIVDVPESRSFPSGHAAHATAAALVLTRVWQRARAMVWIAATVVAVARVYLGIHYPLDALAGCATGLACGWVALHIPRFPAAR